MSWDDGRSEDFNFDLEEKKSIRAHIAAVLPRHTFEERDTRGKYYPCFETRRNLQYCVQHAMDNGDKTPMVPGHTCAHHLHAHEGCLYKDLAQRTLDLKEAQWNAVQNEIKKQEEDPNYTYEPDFHHINQPLAWWNVPGKFYEAVLKPVINTQFGLKPQIYQLGKEASKLTSEDQTQKS